MKPELLRLSTWAWLLAASCVPSLAFAQAQPPQAGVAATQPATTPTPTAALVSPPAAAAASSLPPSAAGSAGDLPPPTAALADAESCVPACRTGFLCHQGQCISACNPPCAAGETCTSGGECLPRAAAAPVPSADGGSGKAAGAEQHDGFLLRLALGFGGAGANVRSGIASEGQLLEYSGGAGFFTIDLGTAVIENLIIHARLGGFGIADPNVKADGANLGKYNNTTLGFGMLGIGGSYYFMPLNLYVGGSLGVARATYSDSSSQSFSSHAGFALDLECGKEWWVSDNWGLGVALRISHASVPPSNIAPYSPSHLNGTGLGVLFSATYN